MNMKKPSSCVLLAAVTAFAACSHSVSAVERIKQNNTTALNLAGSWDTLPGDSDIATWNNTVAGANASALGAGVVGGVSWLGIKIVNPGGLVTIGNTTTAAGGDLVSGTTDVLTLGTSGIDMSSATMNLLINGNMIIGGNQSWQVASGRTLQIQTINTTARMTGSGNLNLVNSTGSGTATFDLRPGSSGSTGFTDQNGFYGYSGNWTINSGVLVKCLRNGQNAWGSGTITLNGGTIAEHQNFSGTWTNNIILQDGSASTIDDANSSGARTLKLQGVISGGATGNLTIAETGSASYAINGGVILTNTNTLGGQVTIATNGVLRVGGVAGATNISTDAGASGTLGTATIVNNGTLTLSRSDTWTFANNITSGTGAVTIGGVTGTLVTGAGTQVVTMSGTSTYTGATTVGQGRLNLTGSLTSAVTVQAAGKISGTGSTTGLLTTVAGSGLVLTGGATTTSLTANGATFAGATTMTFDALPIATTYDIVTYGSGALTTPGNLTTTARGEFVDDVINKKYTFVAGGAQTRTWNTTDGFWDQGSGGDLNWVEGDQLFYSMDSVVFNEPAADSVITIPGARDPASVTVNNTTNTYTFSGAGSITGSAGLSKSGAGTLKLASANTFTGGTTITAGSIILTNGGALGSTGTITLNSPATGASDVSLLVDASGGTLTFARALTIANEGSGTTTLGSSALAATMQAQFSGAITLNKDVSLTGVAGGDRTQFSGGIGGTGNVKVTGAGRVIFLTTANTYVGNTEVDGILQLSDGSATAVSLIPDASNVTVNGGKFLRLAKGANSETIGGLNGSGTVEAISSTNTLTVGSGNATGSFSGTLKNNGGTLSLTKIGSGTQTLGGSNTYSGTTTLNAGTLAVTVNTALGSGLSNASGETTATLDFGSSTVILGNTTAGNTGAFFYGKLVGTGTLQLRGGSLTIHNADGTAGTSGNYQIILPTTAAMPTGVFALDTGSSVTDRKDFSFANDTNDVLTLKSLTGYGAIRSDAGGTASATVTRYITVDQSTGDTVFNGAVLSHKSGSNAVRALTIEKKGSSALTLAGFIGKETTSANAGAAAVNLIANGGILDVTNAFNTTTTNADAINLGTVTVTSGTLGFASQALINTAGNKGATAITMNGGTLRWDTGNTQDITAGGRLILAAGKIAIFDTNGNDVAFTTAFGGGAINASMVKTGEGILALGAGSNFTGGTTVSTGTLLANNPTGSATGSGLVEVNNNATLGGTGTVEAVVVKNGGTIAPGDGVGTLAVYTEATIDAGARIAWQISDWTGAAGTGYDTLEVDTLVVDSSVATPAVIVISPASLANFSESAKTFTIATTVGGISGLDADEISIDASAFTGLGTWAVQDNAGNLELTYTPGAASTYLDWVGTFTFAPGADKSPTGDPDNDGIANGVEMVLGGNPATGMDTALLPTVELVTNPGGGVPVGDYLLYTYRRADQAVDAGLGIVCEYDSDLVGPWSMAEDGVDNVVELVDSPTFDPPATTPTKRVRVYIPLGANTELFGRISVAVPQ